MNNSDVDVIVAGHLCLDLHPALDTLPLVALSTPGQLYESGPLAISTGGAVSNTGLALHRLGVHVQLMAAVGDDLIGSSITAFLRDRDPALTKLLKVQSGQPGSYTVVLSPQNVDRIFLHCTGTNETFGADDINYEQLKHAKIFHFGYPPLLPRMIANEGAQLHEVMTRAKETGVVTSMDTAQPDPTKPIGSLPWGTIIAGALVHTDIFVPSIEEIVFMLRREDFDRWDGKVIANISRDYMRRLSDDLLAMGAVITGFKLGALGMYLRTAKTGWERLSRLGLDTAAWADFEGWHPSFAVKVIGTTGAGDSAYAALLAGLLRGLSPAEALRWACAVGGCNVEKADSTSGIRTWEATAARLAAGWATNPERPAGF